MTDPLNGDHAERLSLVERIDATMSLIAKHKDFGLVSVADLLSDLRATLHGIAKEQG